MRILVAALALSCAFPALAQPAPPPADWKDFAPLVGTWDADADPNGGSGWFSLAPELQGRVLVRKNHAEYPASGKRPAGTHDDVMIIYRDGNDTRADYWDNEGHVIRYAVTAATDKITFVSDATPGKPRFRLTYDVKSAGALALRFEIAMPGSDKFGPYITATVHRRR